MVLVGQGVGHHTHHLLPGSLAGGGELLAEVGGQDDDEDVTQELWGGSRAASGEQCPPRSPHKHSHCTQGSLWKPAVLKTSPRSFLRCTLNLVSALALKVQVLLPYGKSNQKLSRVFWSKFFFVPSGFVLEFLSSRRPSRAPRAAGDGAWTHRAQTRSSC